jgi:predicted small integral membrane protein
MIPRAVLFMGNVIADPLGYWHVILHDTLGIMAVILGIIVGVTFIIRRDMPLKLLKRFRPVMLLILFLWITTFFLGFMVYMVGWESFLPF